MRLQLLGLESWTREQERRGEIVPHCVAQKIGQMETIPRRGPFMPFECCARTAPLLNERAIRPFDPHALWSEHPAPVVSPNMLEYGTGLTSVDERSGPP